MEKIVLRAAAREETGKSVCKHLRESGRIPGIVYKGGEKALKLHLDAKDLWHALHTEAGENAVITLDISDGDKHSKKTVIVQNMQHEPINDQFLHVDFHEISLKEKLKVKVPVVVKGDPPGVAEEEGVLSQIEWELEVECLPTEIPEQIEVRVDGLHMNDAIYIKDIVPPEDVQFLGDPEQVVVVVSPPKAEEEEVVEEAGLEEAEEPEVIKKGKKEEEEVVGEAEGAEGAKEETPGGEEG